MENDRSGAQTEATSGVQKKWVKNGIEKIMQRGDHRDGLVMLIPMVETVWKTKSVWVQNGQTREKLTDYK